MATSQHHAPTSWHEPLKRRYNSNLDYRGVISVVVKYCIKELLIAAVYQRGNVEVTHYLLAQFIDIKVAIAIIVHKSLSHDFGLTY